MNLSEVKTAVKDFVAEVGLEGRSLYSINDMSAAQIRSLLELGRLLEPWQRSRLDLLPGCVLLTLFFQPSTRTRLSFETAMMRLGGSVLSEASPLVTSSAAKEESLSDMLRVVSKYADVTVLRHFDADECRSAAPDSECPVINAGWGHWEHPTQALLDLFTLYRTFGRIEGLKVCVASPDLVEARTGHSMAQGLVRLGADVTLASQRARRTPEPVMQEIAASGGRVKEELDLSRSGFRELISGMDVVYLPGCSAPKGLEAEAFKKSMDDYYVPYETLAKVREAEDRTIYVTHTLPRRPGEMDPRIDASPHQLYFEAVASGVIIRMALLVAVLGGRLA